MLPLKWHLSAVRLICETFLVQETKLVFQIPVYANQEVFWSLHHAFSVNINLTAGTIQQQNMHLSFTLKSLHKHASKLNINGKSIITSIAFKTIPLNFP